MNIDIAKVWRPVNGSTEIGNGITNAWFQGDDTPKHLCTASVDNGNALRSGRGYCAICGRQFRRDGTQISAFFWVRTV